jgi:hypothetical protein
MTTQNLCDDTKIAKNCITWEDPQNKKVRSMRQTHFPRSGDVIHPQLRCGSGYKTSSITCLTKWCEGSFIWMKSGDWRRIKFDPTLPTANCSAENLPQPSIDFEQSWHSGPFEKYPLEHWVHPVTEHILSAQPVLLLQGRHAVPFLYAPSLHLAQPWLVQSEHLGKVLSHFKH